MKIAHIVKTSIVALLFAQVPLEAASLPVPHHVEIRPQKFTFSKSYTLDSDIGPQGSVAKSKLSLRTTYQYYNQHGEYVSCAYKRVFSLGSFYTWAGVMDVYDGKGECLGLIEGAIMTLLPSRFSFYDAGNRLLATAYMDSDALGFSVLDAKNEAKAIAHYRRVFVKDVPDHWIVTINDPTAVDIRLLYSFGAFVVDNQGDFRKDD
ncbi:MAG: hypothetical protein JSR80_00005 [Verrucomicrobia bacterium]|nr:hypothetical protein [Verrucomicrobiota bacterium]